MESPDRTTPWYKGLAHPGTRPLSIARASVPALTASGHVFARPGAGLARLVRLVRLPGETAYKGAGAVRPG